MDNNDSEILEGEYEDSSDTALVAVDKASDLVLGTETAHKALMLRAKGLEALRLTSIKALKPDDFHRFGDNYWLESSGVSKLIEIYGISFTAPKFTKEWDAIREPNGDITEKGKYIWRCELTAHFPMDHHRTYTTIGSASSRDDFFAKLKDGTYRHYLDVDSENVRKKAETNARVKALIGLGIANFTPEELAQAGLDTSRATGHDYKSGSPTSGPSEKQMNFVRGLFEKKVAGMDASTWFDWFEKQGVTSKQGSNLIEWLKDKEDGSVDYEEQFKGEYKNVIAGKYAKPKEDKK